MPLLVLRHDFSSIGEGEKSAAGATIAHINDVNQLM
jgi:hypothetical protein